MARRFRHLSQGVYGAWRLARLDSAAMALFERSPAGVWRSFYGAAAAFPGFLLAGAWYVPPGGWIEPGPLPVLVALTLAYIAHRAAFPLIVLPFCDWIERQEQSLDFIIAYNWSLVLQSALAVAVIFAAHSLPGPVAELFAIAATMARLGYQWFIARTALEAGGVAATVVVLLDLVLAAAARTAAQSLY
jgi:hypothetical protein